MSDKPMFAFKDGIYSIEALRANIRNCPKICVKSTDLDPTFVTAVTLPEGFDDSREAVAFYQFSGKYFILLGKDKVMSQFNGKYFDQLKDQGSAGLEAVNIQGYLVTKHLLKRIQYIDPALLAQSNSAQDLSASTSSQSRYGDRGSRTPYRGDRNSDSYPRTPRRY